MIPFLEEFHAMKDAQVRIGTLQPGDYAIILSLNFPRALLVEITLCEPTERNTWVHGRILAPDPEPDYNGPYVAFSREGASWCSPVTREQTLDMLLKYQVGNVMTKAMIRKEIDNAQNVS